MLPGNFASIKYSVQSLKYLFCAQFNKFAVFPLSVQLFNVLLLLAWNFLSWMWAKIVYIGCDYKTVINSVIFIRALSRVGKEIQSESMSIKVIIAFVTVCFLVESLASANSSSLSHSHGHPIEILTPNGNETFTLQKESIEALLMHPEVKNRKIVVALISGVFRKGKTFFLNYCLRFMYGNVSAPLGSDKLLSH